MMSAGPCSLASRCVTRQVARMARTNLIQKLVSLIALSNEHVTSLPCAREVSSRARWRCALSQRRQVVADIDWPDKNTGCIGGMVTTRQGFPDRVVPHLQDKKVRTAFTWDLLNRIGPIQRESRRRHR